MTTHSASAITLADYESGNLPAHFAVQCSSDADGVVSLSSRAGKFWFGQCDICGGGERVDRTDAATFNAKGNLKTINGLRVL
jgi:hypothetical protein